MTELLLKNSKVLVIGGSGFVGSRLVEKLVLEHHAEVTVMSRNFSRASSVGRYPVKLVRGDITNSDDVMSVAAGQEMVIDCSYHSDGSPAERIGRSALGARAAGEAVLSQRVKRLVHVSTISVYGPAKDGFIDETHACSPSGDAYGDSKLEAERVLLDMGRKDRLPVVVIQPTVIYGPFSAWSAGPLQKLREGRVALPEKGEGYCNAVYIDDVVDALILAAYKPGVEGERFLISAGEPVTWQRYYEAYQAVAGGELELMGTAEIRSAISRAESLNRPVRRLVSELRTNADLRQLLLAQPVVRQFYSALRSVLPSETFDRAKQGILRQGPATASGMDAGSSRPLVLPARNQLPLLCSRQHVKIDKARRLLGYSPRFDLDSGMALTIKWAKWAKLC